MSRKAFSDALEQPGADMFLKRKTPAGRRYTESRGRGAISHGNYWLGLGVVGSWLKAGLYDGAGRE